MARSRGDDDAGSPARDDVAELLENIGAAAVRFTPAELVELNKDVSAIEIRGARLPEQVQVFSGVEGATQELRLAREGYGADYASFKAWA